MLSGRVEKCFYVLHQPGWLENLHGQRGEKCLKADGAEFQLRAVIHQLSCVIILQQIYRYCWISQRGKPDLPLSQWSTRMGKVREGDCYPLGTLNVGTKYHGNPFNSCLVKNTGVMTEQEGKVKDCQSHCPLWIMLRYSIDEFGAKCWMDKLDISRVAVFKDLHKTESKVSLFQH